MVTNKSRNAPRSGASDRRQPIADEATNSEFEKQETTMDIIKQAVRDYAEHPKELIGDLIGAIALFGLLYIGLVMGAAQ